MRDFIGYAQFEMLWERFLPETPFGRRAKESMTVLAEPEALTRIWEETDQALTLLQGLDEDSVRLSRIQHHLKRLPRFCEDSKPLYDEVEIFQFKKFLHNYKSLGELLDPETRRAFGLHYASEALERLLDTGRQSAESFYVADAYSESLAELRAALRETDAALKALQARRASEIRARWGFDFGSRAFLLVPRDALGPLEKASDLLRVEPFDETKYAIRMQASGRNSPSWSAGPPCFPGNAPPRMTCWRRSPRPCGRKGRALRSTAKPSRASIWPSPGRGWRGNSASGALRLRMGPSRSAEAASCPAKKPVGSWAPSTWPWTLFSMRRPP